MPTFILYMIPLEQVTPIRVTQIVSDKHRATSFYANSKNYGTLINIFHTIKML